MAVACLVPLGGKRSIRWPAPCLSDLLAVPRNAHVWRQPTAGAPAGAWHVSHSPELPVRVPQEGTEPQPPRSWGPRKQSGSNLSARAGTGVPTPPLEALIALTSRLQADGFQGLGPGPTTGSGLGQDSYPESGELC